MQARSLLVLAALTLAVAACGGDANPFGDYTDTSGSVQSTSTRPGATTTAADATTTTPTTAMPPSTAIEQIETSGVFRVGIRNRPFLPLADPETGSGFEPDLARELAARLFSGVTVEFVPLTAAERFSALSDGTIDILLRGTSHTTSRDELAAFSTPYLLDGLAVVTREALSVDAVSDLDGLELAVLAGTTLELQVADLLAASGSTADLLPVDGARALFMAREVDGYVDDWLSAVAFARAEPGHNVLWLGPTDPIAAAVPLGDPIYRDWVDQVLNEIISDGTWDALIADWFAIPLPWTAAEMLARPPTDR